MLLVVVPTANPGRYACKGHVWPNWLTTFKTDDQDIEAFSETRHIHVYLDWSHELGNT